MNTLFILNAAPYGSELTYNGLRLAVALAKRKHNQVRVYLMGDAVNTANAYQKQLANHANLRPLMQELIGDASGQIAACGSCMDVRGLQAADMLSGIHRGTLEELADWSEWADKLMVF